MVIKSYSFKFLRSINDSVIENKAFND